MNKFIEQINFKKVVVIYLVLLVIAVSSITIFLGSIYKEKIKVLYNYHKLTETVEDSTDQNIFKNRISNLSKSSKDIIDIVIIKDNTITYTTNNIYKNELTRINNTNNYYIDSDNNIYKLDSSKEFILDLFNIKKESEDDYYNEFQINTSKLNKYTLNYFKKTSTDEKIIIVSKISHIKNSEQYLKLTLAILALFFMLYWIIVALMIYQNALKLKANAYFWGIFTLLTNFIGVIIYLIFIKNRITCPKCHTNISINDKYCKSCGEKI